MNSESSSYVLCPEAIDSDNRPTVTAFSAFESQLQTLCLKEFPGGIGSWVRAVVFFSTFVFINMFLHGESYNKLNLR